MTSMAGCSARATEHASAMRCSAFPVSWMTVVPTEPGWLDIGTGVPALDTSRARRLLDWAPAHRSDEVLTQFVAALGRGDGGPGALFDPAGGRSLDPAGDPANTPGPRAG